METNDNSLTDPKTITSEISDLLNEFNEQLTNVNSACLIYIQKYEENVFPNYYDSDVLKERMKDAVIRAVNDEL